MYRFCILAGLLAVAWAEGSGETTVLTPMATPTPTPTFTPTPTSSPLPGEIRYNFSLAERIRSAHHYCLGYGENITFFPSSPSLSWTIFLQFPLLSFLDTARRNILLRNIVELADMGDNTGALDGFNESMICVGRYEAYRLSYYEESVLVQLYFESLPVDVERFNESFWNGFMRQPNSLVRNFRGDNRWPAIALDYEVIRGGPTTNVHPRRTVDGDNNVVDDPTLNAVLLRSWPGNVTLEYLEREGILSTLDFAENPDPINYGLTGGDIVFAIIGSILSAIVMGLVILGFCIHPFYLS